MLSYTVKVFTGNIMYANTFNNVYIKLLAEDGESKRTWLMGAASYLCGAESSFSLSCSEFLGKLVLIELDKQRLPLFPQDSWFADKIEVTSPEGHVYKFPIYHWIMDDEVHCFREGTAVRAFEEHHLLAKYARWKEIKQRKSQYCWVEYKEGMPHCMEADSTDSLPCEVQFSFTKDIEFKWTAVQALLEMKLNNLAEYEEPWTDFDAIYRVFCHNKNDVSDYVQQHWKDDAFFGYQFLNGLNPILIRCCKSLPSNFPVTDDMLSLEGGASLSDEMQKGNIFLCDYKRLDGVETNIINGEKQYLMAPLILLHKTPDDELKPVAIQLLVPHTRYTLQINLLARKSLISKDGVFSQYAASGGEGMITILQRSLSSLTYSSLCIPEDIVERGVRSVPNYFYRDDGLKLWDIIHRFVNGVLTYYYKSDHEVQEDTELQDYIKDIFEHGFLSNMDTGIPQSFSTVDQLVKFATMVIFTCSAQHSAVNTGQMEYGDWMPNMPISLQLPPPTNKGTATERYLLNTLPDVNTTVHGLAVLKLLSTQSTDFVALGRYPSEYFCEDVPCKLIKDFEKELKDLDEAIDIRNESLKLPYTYLEPENMENSVSL